MYRHGPTCLQGPVSRHWRAGKRRHRCDGEEPIRTELIQRVRREIAAGTYATPEKWQAALERLLDRLEWA